MGDRTHLIFYYSSIADISSCQSKIISRDSLHAGYTKIRIIPEPACVVPMFSRKKGSLYCKFYALRNTHNTRLSSFTAKFYSRNFTAIKFTAIKFQVHFNRYAALIELQNIPALERIITPDNTRYFIPFSTAPNSPNTPHIRYRHPVVSRPRYSLL